MVFSPIRVGVAREVKTFAAQSQLEGAGGEEIGEKPDCRFPMSKRRVLQELRQFVDGKGDVGETAFGNP